jgi:hypothetical protein
LEFHISPFAYYVRSSYDLSIMKSDVMDLTAKRWLTYAEEYADPDGGMPLRKVAIVAVMANPYAGRYVEDLSPLIEASVSLGERMAKLAVEAMRPYAGLGYGKGGVVGLAGEQEHISALLTTKFAEPLRAALGGGKAWISSMTKRGAPGTTIDIPVNHKDALYVRSFYDGMTLTLPDAPAADEVAAIVVLTNRGRLRARVGGLQPGQIAGNDGLT